MKPTPGKPKVIPINANLSALNFTNQAFQLHIETSWTWIQTQRLGERRPNAYETKEIRRTCATQDESPEVRFLENVMPLYGDNPPIRAHQLDLPVGY